MRNLLKQKSRQKIAGKKDYSNNPLPIARGYNGDCQIGSSPGSGSLLPQPSQDLRLSGNLGSLPITVAGPRRHYTGLPY
jgi:hypothetical protein